MSTLEVLRTKGANKPVTHKVKVPVELANRIDELNNRVKAQGLEVDWDAPVLKTLTDFADAVERDLATATSGANGAANDGAAAAAAA
ncbi:hypothetical protein [Ralstonia pseudosolanacearum]|uniref:hypothetical protein n=1 Tax=Ralstonia pseudosolanacearum TaxID=1310165 RepID=UPI003CF7F10D